MRKIGTLVAAAVVSILVGTGAASAQHGGGWHGGVGWHGGWRGGVYFGFGPWWGPWWDYPYGYPYPYAYPYPYPEAYPYPYAYPAEPVPTAPPANVWYYCRSSKAYYPYVRSCPEAWQQVPAQPPQ